MQRFRHIFNFYINSSIHVSFSVVGLALVTGYLLGLGVDISFLSFLFFGTVTGYNFVKYAAVAGLHHRSLAKSLRAIQNFSVLCGIGLLVSTFWLQWEVILVCGLFGFFTLLYAVPVFSRGRNLRNIAGLKIYIIALVWAGVTVVLPVLQSGLEMYWDAWVVFGQRFLFVLALMVPFEIRDLQYDNVLLKTLPQQLGVKMTKFIGVTWLLLFFFLEFLRDELELLFVLLTLCMAVIVGVGIALSRKRQNPYYASFWIEGIPLFWLWLTVLASYLWY